jgi:glycosyltransferase involved in cell wall biosynthesis
MTARVLVVVEQLRRPVPGGIGRYAVGLLDGLSAGGAGGPDGAVTLFASRPPRPTASAARTSAAAPADPLARFDFEVRSSRLPGRLLTRAWDRGLGSLPVPCDVVHAVSLAVPPRRTGGHRLGAGGPPARPPALCVVVHDLAWRRHAEATTARGRRWHEAALRRALAAAAAVIVPSSAVAEELAADVDRARTRVAVVPWGADHLPPPDHRGAEQLLAAHGVVGPYLLTASTLEPRKNLPRLFAAYQSAVSSLPERWPLVVAGPRGWGGEAASGPATGPGRVVMVGPVGDAVLSGLYAGARLLAYVPLAEGYGFPPVEAMAVGTPVLTSAGVPSVTPEPAEWRGEPSAPVEPAAEVVDAADVDAIAGGLLVVATDDRRRAELAARGRDLVAGRRWSTVAARHRRLWDELG